MVTLCLCVTMFPEYLHGHPTAKGDHATQANPCAGTLLDSLARPEYYTPQVSELQGERMTKAIGCISGGLDSTLAMALVQRQGIEVVAMHILHLWHPLPADPSAKPRAVRAAEALGIRTVLIDAAEADLAMVQHPEHGLGATHEPVHRLPHLGPAPGPRTDGGRRAPRSSSPARSSASGRCRRTAPR